MEASCSICTESHEEGETVNVSSGLNTLIQASHARKDNFHEKWAGKSSVKLHVQCRKSYTRKSSIKANETKLDAVASFSTDKFIIEKIGKKFQRLSFFLIIEEHCFLFEALYTVPYSSYIIIYCS